MNIAQELKESHPETVCLMKCGRFYRCYDADAYIISYLLKFKLTSSLTSDMAGFPSDLLKDVLKVLNVNGVKYRVYEVEKNGLNIQDENNLEENHFDEIYKKAYRYIRLKSRVEKTSGKIVELLGDKTVDDSKIESVIKKIEDLVCKEI